MGNSGNNNGIVYSTIKYQIREFAQKAFTGMFGNELIALREHAYQVNGFKNFFVKRGPQSSNLLFIKLNCLGQFLHSDGKEMDIHLEKRFLTVSRGIPLIFPLLYAAKRLSDSMPQARSMFLSGWFRLARMFSTMRMRSTGESCRMDFSMFLAVIRRVPLSLFGKTHESASRLTFTDVNVNMAVWTCRKNAE